MYLFCSQREQYQHHEQRVSQTDRELLEHRKYPPEKGSKSRVIQDYIEKEQYLQHEVIYSSIFTTSEFKLLCKKIRIETESLKVGKLFRFWLQVSKIACRIEIIIFITSLLIIIT